MRAPISLLLAVLLAASGCASVVQVRPPYEQKVRIGDQVHVTVGDKILHGRVVYVDRLGLVIRTGKTVQQQHPVEAYTYTTQLIWGDVKRLQVNGVLDRRGKLIGEEEIRVNTRTGFRKSLMLNVGILGFAASFGLGVLIQDRYFPPLGQKPISRLNVGRLAFWTTWMGGTVLSATGGYVIGNLIDRRRSAERVELIRGAEEGVQAKPHP
ncbi:MAG: hypothetical protein EXS64_17275 [Candidatus Latescibacteria bacterium]|nr:hypothetical protein [Candidatus Latescibacterota bacterium]